MNAETLRAIRRDLGLYQRELAPLLGVSTHSLHMYETGRPIPRAVAMLAERMYADVARDQNRSPEPFVLRCLRCSAILLEGESPRQHEEMCSLILHTEVAQVPEETK